MPRLRNTQSGSVVNVADDLAGRLGAGWESVDDEPDPSAKKASVKKTPAKSSDDK